MTESNSPHQSQIERLLQIMHTLRSPGGCPWDIEQTHESLIPSLIEEAYEVAEALRSGDRSAARRWAEPTSTP